MWIKTQQGELFNLDRLRSIRVVDGIFERRRQSCSHEFIPPHVTGYLGSDRSVTLGSFDTRAEADAYFNQLEKLLTKESDHD